MEIDCRSIVRALSLSLAALERESACITECSKIRTLWRTLYIFQSISDLILVIFVPFDCVQKRKGKKKHTETLTYRERLETSVRACERAIGVAVAVAYTRLRWSFVSNCV